MIFVDTGFLVALAQPTDELHQRARAWASRINEPLLLTQYVHLEVMNHLSRVADRARAGLITSHVLSSPGYEFLYVSEEGYRAGLELHQARQDKEWSLTDCISFHIMRERGIRKALAFDQHFEQAGFVALLRQDPPGG